MHQAKRGLINDCLYKGTKINNWKQASIDTINNFPELRGFNCEVVLEKNLFKGKTERLIGKQQVTSSFKGEKEGYVVIENNSLDAIQAVNDLLKQGKKVGQITNDANNQGIHQGDFIVGFKEFESIKEKYTLVAQGTNELLEAVCIKPTKVYIAGDRINDSYLGYHYVFDEQMHFQVVDDIKNADIIIDGNDTYLENKELFSQIKKSKKPIIVVGPSACSESFYLSDYAVDYTTVGIGCNALLKVDYANHLVTSGYEEDNELYNIGISGFTMIPSEAEVLVSVKSDEFYTAGWFPDVEQMSGMALALSYETNKVDFISFANVLGYNAHQTDDYRLISNAIFSKRLGEKFEALKGVEEE